MKKVLIIEDNEDNLYLMRKVLQKVGYEVIEAHDGATGVELAITKKPNIILLDIQLPVLDGYSATKKIRENEIIKNVIIICIISFPMEIDKEKALAVGCNDFIEKPFNLQSFIELLKKY